MTLGHVVTTSPLSYTVIAPFFLACQSDSEKAVTCGKTRHQMKHSSGECSSYFTLIYRPFQSVLHGRVHGELGSSNPPLPPLQMPRPTIRLGNASALLPLCVQSKGFPLPYQNARILRCSDSFACCRTDERSCPNPHVSQLFGIDSVPPMVMQPVKRASRFTSATHRSASPLAIGMSRCRWITFGS